MNYVIVIPARLQSSRLPRKPLLIAGGRALLHHTYEAARKTRANKIIVAAADKEIYNYCKDHNLCCWNTDPEHPTGTHRCVEILRELNASATYQRRIDVVVNWQCDEPLVNPKYVDRLVDFLYNGSYGIATLVSWKGRPTDIRVAVSNKCCHWFTRAPMVGMFHTGIYAFESSLLQKLDSIVQTYMSMFESLEQLAWLEEGHKIAAFEIPEGHLSINTTSDFHEFKTRIENGKETS